MNTEGFWVWFLGVAPQLQRGIDEDNVDDGLMGEVDRAVLSLGDFGWEVGPHGDGYILTLSPGSDLELLEEAEAIVAGAPNLPRWRFLSSRPWR